jgi:ankyrin repeat protein
LTPEVKVPLLHAVLLFGHKYHSELADSVDLLVSAGADMNCTSTISSNTNTALMWACSEISCCMEPLRALLKAGAAVHYSTEQGFTAVMVAARAGNLEAVQVLLEHGADPFAVDAEGRDAVFKAATSGNLALLELLMNLRDDGGAALLLVVLLVQTALHLYWQQRWADRHSVQSGCCREAMHSSRSPLLTALAGQHCTALLQLLWC